jgi:hypothetical protein
MPVGLSSVLEAFQRNLFSLEPSVLMPFAFMLGALGLLAFVAESAGRALAADRVFLAIWLIIFASMLYASPYSPGRYWVTIVPPMMALGAHALVALTESRRHPLLYGSSMSERLAFCVLLALPAVAFLILSQNLEAIAPALNRRAVRYPLYAAMFFYLVYFATPFSPGFSCLRAAVSRVLERKGSLILVSAAVLFLVSNGSQYLNWCMSRQYTVVEAAAMLGDLLPARAVVLGGQATTLTMESDLVAIPTWPNNDWVNGAQPWKRYQADYWIEPCGTADCSDINLPVPTRFIRSFPNQRYTMGLWRVIKDYEP